VSFKPIFWTQESWNVVNVKLWFVQHNHVIMNFVSSLTMDLEQTLFLQWQRIVVYHWVIYFSDFLDQKYKSRINNEVKEGICFCWWYDGHASLYDSYSIATRRDVRVRIFRKSLVDVSLVDVHSFSSLQRHWINHVPVSGLRHEQ
jgi:hypothetical protein